MAYSSRGSGFVGLTNYLGLNRQAGERMGEQLAQRVENSTNAARGAVDAGSTEFDQRSQAGTPGAAPYGLDAAERDAWLTAHPPAYTGPKQLGDVADLSAIEKLIDTAGREAQLAGTDYGRAALMGGTGPQGGRMLDAALAGRGGGARLEQATKGYQGLKDYLGLAKTNAAGMATAGEQKASTMRAEQEALHAPSPTKGAYGPSLAEKQYQEQKAAVERQRQWRDAKVNVGPSAGGKAGEGPGMWENGRWVPYILSPSGRGYIRDPNYKG